MRAVASALVGTFLLCCLAAWSDPGAAAPRIASVSPAQGDRITIQGRDFGSPCARCEVLAQYEGGARIALVVDDWGDGRIVARLPDLNAGRSARLSVNSNGQASPPVAARVAVSTRRRVIARHESARKVGDKGELSVDVSQRPPRCAAASPVFDSARIRYRKRRFGEAEIVSAPPSGCTACAPVVVRWYHEPTGAIDFEVEATWRMVEGSCPARTR